MTAPAAKTSPKSAPKPASWAYAEDFSEESEAASQARAVVEIGTGSGVSGLALFAGMQPEGILTSVDIEAEHQQAARRSFVSVGIPSRRFRLIGGSALTVLPKLSDGAYDLVFVDADKMEYAEYVDQGVRLLRHGGVLVVNNAFGSDRTPDLTQNDEETESLRAALHAVRENEDLLVSLLPVGDGLLVAAKR